MYAVDFNNMQIIVGQVKGAHLKGISSLHVVDRFSHLLPEGEKDRRDNRPCLAQCCYLCNFAASFQRGEGLHVAAHDGQTAGA
jgi:hypothetical protein